MALNKRIEIDIIANDEASAVYRKVIHSTASMATNINNSLLSMNMGLRKYNIAMYDFNLVARRVFNNASNLVYNFTKDAINNFIALEQQHAKTMGAMATNYDNTASAQRKFIEDSKALRDQSIKLGTVGPKGTGALYNPTEVSSVQTALVKAGKSPKDVATTDAVSNVLKFAGANDLEIGTAADFAVTLGTQFNIPMKEWGGMLDKVTKAADISVVDVEDIIETMKYAGGIASGLDRPVEEVLAAVSSMGNAGLKGSMAGTGIQQFYTRLLSPVGKSQAVLDKAPGIAGDVLEAFIAQTVEDTPNGKKFKPLVDVVPLLDEAMSALDDTEQAWFAQKLFGLFQMKAGYAIQKQDNDGIYEIDKMIDMINNSSEGANDKKYTLMLASTYGQVEALQNAWYGTKTDVGFRLSPLVNALTNELLKFLTSDGTYEIDFSKLKDAINDTGDLIAEKYGQDLGNLVSSLGNRTVDGGLVLGAISPTLGGIVSSSLDLLGGDPVQAWNDLQTALANTKDNINELPPELQDLAKKANAAAMTLATLAGINLGTKILETITTLWRYTGGKIAAGVAKITSPKTDVDSASIVAKSTTMTVNANVVNVYGKAINSGGVPGTGVPGTGDKGTYSKRLSGPTAAKEATGGASLLTMLKGAPKNPWFIGGLLLAGATVYGANKVADGATAWQLGAGIRDKNGNINLDEHYKDVISEHKVPNDYIKAAKEAFASDNIMKNLGYEKDYVLGRAASFYAQRQASGLPVSKADYMTFIRQSVGEMRKIITTDGISKVGDPYRLPSVFSQMGKVSSTGISGIGGFGTTPITVAPKITLPKVNLTVNVDKSGNVKVNQGSSPYIVDYSDLSGWIYKQTARNGK